MDNTQLETLIVSVQASLDTLKADLATAVSMSKQAGQQAGQVFGAGMGEASQRASDFKRGMEAMRNEVEAGVRSSKEFASALQVEQGELRALIGTVQRGSDAYNAYVAQLAQVNNELKKVDGATQQAHGGMKGFNVGLANLSSALNVAQVALQAVQQIARQGFGFLKLAGEAEQTQVAFAGLLKDGEKAKSFLAELAQFAANTPFELEGLKQTSRQLLAFGFDSKAIIPILTAVGDAVGTMGGDPETMERVIRALGQMQAKGKVTAEEMAQIAETGLPVWKMLADQIGVSIPEAMKMAEKGAITSGQGIAAILQGMQKDFGGGMAKQSQTLLGMWSNTTDTLQQTATQLSTFLAEKLGAKEILGNLNEGLGKVKAMLDNGGIETAWKRVTGAFSESGSVFAELKTAVTGNLAAIRDTVQNVLIPIFERIKPVVMAVWAEVPDIISGAASFIQGAFQLIQAAWQNILKPVWDAIGPAVKDAVSLVGNLLSGTLELIGGVFKSVARLINGDWKGAWQVLKDSAVKALTGIGEAEWKLWDTLKGMAGKAWEKAKEIGVNLKNGILEGIKNIQAELAEAIGRAMQSMLGYVPDWAQRLLNINGQAQTTMLKPAQMNTSQNGYVSGTTYSEAALNTPMDKRYAYSYISGLKDVFKNDPQVASDCASIASSIMRNLGQSIRTSANAGVLEQNAIKAGYQKVNGDEIKPGDLIVWTSGNGKTYGAVSGKHVGVAAGYQNGKLMVINNPGQSNTVVEAMYDRQNAVAYRAPQSPYAHTAAPAITPTAPQKTTKPTDFNALLGNSGNNTPETAEEIRKRMDAQIKAILAKVDIKLLTKEAAAKLLQKIEDDATATARKGGKGWEEFAATAKQAGGAIESLNKKTKELSKDALGDLRREFEYVGKSGLPEYVKGLQALISEQEKVASSAKKGSKEQKEAMDVVIASRAALKDAQNGKGAAFVTDADLKKYRAQAEEVIRLEKNLQTSTDAAWRQRATNRIQEFQKLPQAAQNVLTLLKGQDQAEDQLNERAKNREKERKALIARAAQEARQLRDENAQATLNRIKDNNRAELDAFKGTAAAKLDLIRKQSQAEFDAGELVARIQKQNRDRALDNRFATDKDNPLYAQLKAQSLQTYNDIVSGLRNARAATMRAANEAVAQESKAAAAAQAEADGKTYAETLKSTIESLPNRSWDGLLKLYDEATATRDKDLLTAVFNEMERRGLDVQKTAHDAWEAFYNQPLKTDYRLPSLIPKQPMSTVPEGTTTDFSWTADWMADQSRAQALDDYALKLDDMNEAQLKAEQSAQLLAGNQDKLRLVTDRLTASQKAWVAALKSGPNPEDLPNIGEIKIAGFQQGPMSVKPTDGRPDLTPTMKLRAEALLLASRSAEAFTKSLEDLTIAELEAKLATVSTDEQFEEIVRLLSTKKNDLAASIIAVGEAAAEANEEGVTDLVKGQQLLVTSERELHEAMGAGKPAYAAQIQALQELRSTIDPDNQGLIAQVDALIKKWTELQQKMGEQGQVDAALEKFLEYARMTNQVLGAVGKLTQAMSQTEQQYDRTGKAMNTPWTDLAANIEGAQKGIQLAMDMSKDVAKLIASGGSDIGAWISLTTKVVSAIADALSGFKKAYAEAQRLRDDFAESNPLLNAPDFQKVSVQSRGLLADIFMGPKVVNEIDKVGVHFANSFAEHVANGFSSGLKKAILEGDTSQIGKNLRQDTYEGIIGGMIESFKTEVIKDIMAPFLKAWADAMKTPDTADDMAALDTLERLMPRLDQAGQAWANAVTPRLQQIQDNWGIGEDGSTGPSGSLFGNAPGVQLGVPRLEVSLPADTFKGLSDFAATVPRWEGITARLEGVLGVTGVGLPVDTFKPLGEFAVMVPVFAQGSQTLLRAAGLIERYFSGDGMPPRVTGNGGMA